MVLRERRKGDPTLDSLQEILWVCGSNLMFKMKLSNVFFSEDLSLGLSFYLGLYFLKGIKSEALL